MDNFFFSVKNSSVVEGLDWTDRKIKLLRRFDNFIINYIFVDQEQRKKIISEIESGYDLISEKFSQTRSHFWRDLEYIKNYAQDGDQVLDFGCGNGRLLELIGDKNIQYFGVDISSSLIGIARQKYSGNQINFQKISSLVSLPFKDDFFNVVCAIAVLHHFPGKEYQLSWAKELYRVTKPGGACVITVWNLWQRKYMAFIIKNWWHKIRGKSQLDWNDAYIPFGNNKREIFWRYHHAFTRGELSRIFQKAGFKIIECKRAGKNWVVIGKK